MARRLFKQLAAIVIGNAIYFLLLTPHLPPAAQHRPDKLDLGLLVDFWICVVVYGIFELIARRRREEFKAAESLKPAQTQPKATRCY